MGKYEEKLLSVIQENFAKIFMAVMIFISLLLRWFGRAHVSGDAGFYLLPWFEEIKAMGGGRTALQTQVGDYNVLFQMLIALMTHLPFKPLYMYKGLSILFDYALAGCVSGIVWTMFRDGRKAGGVFLACVFLPTVVWDSSIWAQSDSIYTTFVMAALLCLLRKRYKWTFVLLGIAFAFKIQTVFILPFLLIYYFQEKKFSLLHFFITPLVAFATSLPAVFSGRSLFCFFEVYFAQTNQSPSMSVSFPSVWTILGGDYYLLKSWAIWFTIALLGAGMYAVYRRKTDLTQKESFVSLACWTVWTTILFMPAMHERYSYMLDILMLLLMLVNLKKYKLVPFVEIFCSMCTYAGYLFGMPMNIRLIACIYFGDYILYTYFLLTGNNQEG